MNPRACINLDENVLTVTVVWKGVQPMASPHKLQCGLGLGLYGPSDRERHVVSFATVILK